MDNGLAVSRWRHVIKRVAVPVLHGSGALWLARLRAGGDRLALNYHNVEPTIFAAHAAFLQRHAEVVDLETLLTRPPAPRGRSVVTLTFDDGYASFETSVMPILARFRFPATWFVPTALVGTNQVFWFDRVRAAVLGSTRGQFVFQGRAWVLQHWNRDYVASAISKYLKRVEWPEREHLINQMIERLGEPPASALRTYALTSRAFLRSMDPGLVVIGSHSHTHPQLSHLSAEALADELSTSKRLLEEWSGRPVRHFAYPSGDCDATVARAIQAAGYAFAWTTQPRFLSPDDDPYRLPRIPVDDRAPVSILSAKMTPWVHRWGRA